MRVAAALEVQNVRKSFGELRAVDGVSFDVRPGEILGFLGPNGAGKTTTLRMIMGITRPDEGAIHFEGRPELDRRSVGYLPEERGLFEDASLLDTLVYLGTLRGMSRAAARATGREWLERVQLADHAKAKLNTLSKGNQQKVQFAGAVLHRPSLAVLDEPFAGLDPLNQEQFLGFIRELRDQGAAVLLSAHQLDLVERLCDRFFLIARGRHLLSGTLDAIRRATPGGEGELLTVGLRVGHAAAADPARTLLGRIAPGIAVAVGEGANGWAQVELALPPRQDLSPILVALGGQFEVESVQMRRLPLHEIYVRAVRADHDSATAEREVARV